MSEAMTNHEIEDVLSSIRRLVSEEHRPQAALVPVAVPVAAPEAKLLLTPALRVVARGEPVAEPAQAVFAVAAAVPEPDWQEDILVPDAGDAMPDWGAGAWDDASPQPAAPQMWDASESAVPQMDLPAPEIPGSDNPDLDLSGLDMPDLDMPERPPVSADILDFVLAASGFGAGTTDAAAASYDLLTQAEAPMWTDAPEPDPTGAQAWEPEAAMAFVARPRAAPSADLPPQGQNLLARAWADRAEAAVRAELLGTVAPRAQPRATATTGDDASGDDLPFDEEALREIVRDMIREELAGTLGERITRNVRKLVRMEINRAATTRAFD